MLLQEQGAQVRVFEAAGSSFHMKAYLFAHFNDDRHLHGTAFIGSSNISRRALKNGLEWNYRIDYPGDDGFLEAARASKALFRHPRTTALSDAWIDGYERRRIVPPRAISPGSDETELPPVPTPVQAEALEALRATRKQAYRRGLVVLATGLGKTGACSLRRGTNACASGALRHPIAGDPAAGGRDLPAHSAQGTHRPLHGSGTRPGRRCAVRLGADPRRASTSSALIAGTSITS